ncbi:MAG: hypothetical protein M3253_09435, partial [Chloroflexota bacterium]|nr:hypothetical protein [Chloroflexota bacterium]
TAMDVRQQPVARSATLTRLLSRQADAYFRALRMRWTGEATPPFEPAYGVGVVLAGRGTLEGVSRRLDLAPGVTFALPAAAVTETRLVSDEEVELIWCLGPDPAALDRHPLPRPRPAA